MVGAGQCGLIMLSRSRARAKNSTEIEPPPVRTKPVAKPKPRTIFSCWKCDYRTIDEDMLEEHMALNHLVGQNVMRLLAKQHPSLLFTTFHRENSLDSVESGINKLDDGDGNDNDKENINDIDNDQGNNSEVQTETENVFDIFGIEDLDEEQDGNILDIGFVETPQNESSNKVAQLTQPDPIERSVSRNSRESEFRRATSDGGIRNTPTRKAAIKAKQKANLVPGGRRNVKEINDIGEFTNKYKSAEKTKNLIGKHGKEAAENLLKLNNTKVDGLDKKNNGFVLIYKAGDKTYIVNEGVMGKDFVENHDVRNDILENATKVEVKLNTQMLTSILKGQYGKSMDQNTPKGHKRKDYKGIGAENKTKRNPKKNTIEDEEDDNSEESGQTPPRKKEKGPEKKHLLKKRNMKKRKIMILSLLILLTTIALHGLKV